MQEVTKSEPQLPQVHSIIVIDIETSNLRPHQGGKIVEVAAINVSLHSYRKTVLLNRVCNPEIPYPTLKECWTCQNGYISPREILAGPLLATMGITLKALMGNYLWTSFNAFTFEWLFLQRAPWNLSSPSFCLMTTMADVIGHQPRWATSPRRPSLVKAHRYVGGTPDRIHRALDDADMAADILIWLFKKNIYKKETLGHFLIPPIERPMCDKCKSSEQWDLVAGDWFCQRCRDYDRDTGRY